MSHQRRRDGLIECFASGRVRKIPSSLLVSDRAPRAVARAVGGADERALFERMRAHCAERYGADETLREMFEQWHRLLATAEQTRR